MSARKQDTQTVLIPRIPSELERRLSRSFEGIHMEKLVLDERDLSARWGVNVKTL